MSSFLFPSEEIRFLKDNGVQVDYVLQHLPGYVSRNGDMSPLQPVLSSTPRPPQFDDGCKNCGKVSQSRNNGVIDRLADNVLWAKESTIVYHTLQSQWPSPHVEKLVSSAADVAIWAWNQIGLGITLEHRKGGGVDKLTHLIIFGSDEDGNVAASGTFPKNEEGVPRITFNGTAFRTTPTDEVERLLSRMIHEVGHTLGFYHEFEADNGYGYRVGESSPKSIMGYEMQRKVTTADLSSFKKIYEYEDGTVFDESTGYKILRKSPKLYNLDDHRQADSTSNDPRQNGILTELLSPFLRMFDTNRMIVEKDIKESTNEPTSLMPITSNGQIDEEARFRNSGFLSSLAGKAIKTITKVGKSVVIGAAGGALQGAVQGAEEGLKSGLGRGSDGVIIKETIDPQSIGFYAFSALSNAGMKSVSVLVSSRHTPSAGINNGDGSSKKEEQAMICGEWLLSKYSQLLLVRKSNLIKNGMFPVDDPSDSGASDEWSEEQIKVVANASIGVIDEEFVQFFAGDLETPISRTDTDTSMDDLLEKVVEYGLSQGQTLPPKVEDLIVTELRPSEGSAFGHVAFYNPGTDGGTASKSKIIFYSIVPAGSSFGVGEPKVLTTREVSFISASLFDKILRNNDSRQEIAGFFAAKNQRNGGLLLSLGSSLLNVVGSIFGGGRGNDENDGTRNSQQIRIMGAMINPSGGEPEEQEWVSIMNCTPNTCHLAGWKLRDGNSGELTLTGSINAFETKKIHPRTYQLNNVVTLKNTGGALKLMDREGSVVDSVSWKDVREGEAVSFI